jgi:putative transposase
MDHEGEVLESYVSKRRHSNPYLKSIKRNGQPRIVVTDKLRFYRAAMMIKGNADRQEIGRWINNRAENSHLPFRRRGRERAMLRFCRAKTLQNFVSIHASIQNHFNQEHHLNSHTNFKPKHTAALAEWRQLLNA